MGKHKKNQSDQNDTKMIDAVCTCPYELASIQLYTDKVPKVKRKTKSTHICKCDDDKKIIKKPKTWNSITQMHGNAYTTELWDKKNYKADLKKTKKHDKKRHKIIQESGNNGTNMINTKFNEKINKRNKLSKKSTISLYSKPMKNKNISVTKNLKDKEVPLRFLNLTHDRKTKTDALTNFHGTGDACIGGPCREGKEYRNPQMGNKQVAVGDKNLKRIYVGHGDQTAQITSVNKRKFGLLKKFFSHTCKCDVEKEHTLHLESGVQEPYFEMKVDSLNMRVLNSDEIIENVRKYGGKGSCICPSRLARLNGNKQICRKGVCEKAQIGKTKFDCKCLKKDVIECKESTCNTKRKIKHQSKRQPFQAPTFVNKSKPLLKVMLDSNDMSIMNTNEVKDIIGKTSYNQVCPNGICNVAGQDKDYQYICKCTNKKFKPLECTEETCIRPEKKCRLLYLCSRIFSKSENWPDQINNIPRKRRKSPTYMTVTDKDNLKVKSDVNKRNGLSINISRGIHKKPRVKKEDTLPMPLDNVGCVCECDQIHHLKQLKKSSIDKELQALDIYNQIKKEKNQEKKNKGKKQSKKSKKKVKERQMLHILRHKNMTFKERVLYCLKAKRVRCERRLKEEEKAFESYEKKAIKQNRKIKKEQEDNKHIEEVRWNCITKFISGVLNLTFESTKNIIITAFSLITNPIGSYVYIRQRSKNPPATLTRLGEWFTRTWGDRSTKISKPLQDLNAINVIADQIEDSAVFNTLFASKGRTKAERALYDRKRRLRKRRMKKRHDEALYGCHNMLLTTMRKTPCIWFYYICPNMYPQCLSLVNFMNNFFNVIIFLGAFLCWTPCILTFELCRAFMCCFLCTN